MNSLTIKRGGFWLAWPLALLVTFFCFRAGWPREQAIMAGIVILAALLWVTEALPIFATAVIVVAAEILLLTNPTGSARFAFEAVPTPPFRAVLGAMADPVLVLFFSGFVMARAAVKEGVDLVFGGWLLRPFARQPTSLLFGIIGVTALFSMWMSNTATTAFMLTLVAPLLTQLPPGEPYRKALLLAVPFAANVGGMGTPIASPPNAIALGYLNRAGHSVGFVEWMMIGVPLVLVLLVLLGTLLLRFFPAKEARGLDIVAPSVLSRRGIATVVIFTTTVLLWVSEALHGIPSAAVALLPLVALLIGGVITRDDINRLDWDVLLLIGGGFALGWGLSATQLDQRIVTWLPGAGESSGVLLVALVAMTLGLGTFLSNTAVANLLLPIGVAAASAGAQVSVAVSIALTASLSMALPISTPPNAMAFARGHIVAADMIKAGALIGVIGTTLIVTGALLLSR